MTRRSLLKNSIIGLTGMSVLGGLYAWQVADFWLEFVKIAMPVKNLPPALAGKTLMQISDIHIGNRFDFNFIIDSFNNAKKYQPDFVVYTGDYFTTHREEVQYLKLEKVLTHAVKGKLGTAGILCVLKVTPLKRCNLSNS